MTKRSSDPTPEEQVDELLAAPDATRKSETERRKVEVRKAHEAARAEQLANSKHQGDWTLEDVLADMVKLAEDEIRNKLGHKDRTLTRKRYARLGGYIIEDLEKRWGQFEHLKQMAGLVEQPGTRAKKAALSEASRREHAGRYARRYVRPYVHDPAEERELTDTELVLSISDTHATFLDPFTWHVFLCACRDMQPDVVFLNGDMLEGSEISRFPKIPGWTVPLQMEFDFAREMFRQLRVVTPDADVWWGAGNHGLDRLSMYLTQVAPAIANLRNMRFDKLAGVDEYGIKLAQGGWIASPEGTEGDPEGVLMHGWYRIYHGRSLGINPAHKELERAARSGQSGHTHRAQLYYGTTEALRGMSWMSTPMGCTHRAGRAYMRGLTTGWQKGFGIAFLSPGEKVHQFPVVTEGGRAVFEGFEYEDPGFPEPDPQKLWLPNFEVPI